MANQPTYQQVAEARGLPEAVLDDLRRTRGLSPAALLEIPDPALRRAVRRLEYPDLARAREAFRVRQSVTDGGGVAPDALPNALRQLDSSRARAAAGDQVARMPTGRTSRPAACSRRSRGSAPVPRAGARSDRATSADGRGRSSSTPSRPDDDVGRQRRGRRLAHRRRRRRAGSPSTTSWPTSPSRRWRSTRPTPTSSTPEPARASRTSTRSAARASSGRPTVSHGPAAGDDAAADFQP